MFLNFTTVTMRARCIARAGSPSLGGVEQRVTRSRITPCCLTVTFENYQIGQCLTDDPQHAHYTRPAQLGTIHLSPTTPHALPAPAQPSRREQHPPSEL